MTKAQVRMGGKGGKALQKLSTRGNSVEKVSLSACHPCHPVQEAI